MHGEVSELDMLGVATQGHCSAGGHSRRKDCRLGILEAEALKVAGESQSPRWLATLLNASRAKEWHVRGAGSSP